LEKEFPRLPLTQANNVWHCPSYHAPPSQDERIAYGLNAYGYNAFGLEAAFDDTFGLGGHKITRADDNSCGQIVSGSTSEPGYAASQELWMYYQTTGTLVQNAMFRWAQRGIQYDQNSGVYYNPALTSCTFQSCQIGVYQNTANDTLNISGDTYCNVITPLSYHSGAVNGYITANCGTPTQSSLADASKLVAAEGEPGIGVNPANPSNLFMAANHSISQNSQNVIGARSTDGGLTWGTATALPSSFGDPSVAFDAFGNLFVCYIGVGGASVVVLLSTDGGGSFQTLKTINSSSSYVDWPRVTTGPSCVWVAFRDFSDVAVTGALVSGPGNVTNWTTPAHIQGSHLNSRSSVAVGPTGQVAVICEDQTYSGPSSILFSLNPYGLSQNGFTSGRTILTSNMGGFTYLNATPNRGCNVGASLAWDRTGGQYNSRLYLVYTDRPSTISMDSNIYVKHSTDQGASWSTQVRINDDTGSMSQFDPRIAVDQTSGKVAVSWYDCRDDTITPNVKTKFYAAVSSDGGQTFSPNIQLESGQSDAIHPPITDDWHQEYMDYTGLAYYGGYFYPAWADNSNSDANRDNLDSTGEMDIYVARVQY
jgi:hypothetical protein